MNCKKCNHQVHEDSTGVISCINCGHREEYNNSDLMKRPLGTTSDRNVPIGYRKGHTNDAGEKLQSTEETLKERGNRYGEFENHAYLSQTFKNAFNDHVKEYGQPENFNAVINESIEMIFHKLARIANGDPLYADNFVDICGYSQLVVDELNKND